LGRPRVNTAAAPLVLVDGRCARVRPVHPGDAAAEQAFVAALSPDSRRRRFHGALNRLPAAVVEAMTVVDFRRHVAWVVEAGCADGGPTRLVADARFVREQEAGAEADGAVAGDPQDAAEFAIAVADDWQGMGLGRLLLQRLAAHARALGIEVLHGSVLVDNAPMLALMRRLGATAHGDPLDATIVRVRWSVESWPVSRTAPRTGSSLQGPGRPQGPRPFAGAGIFR